MRRLAGVPESYWNKYVRELRELAAPALPPSPEALAEIAELAERGRVGDDVADLLALVRVPFADVESAVVAGGAVDDTLEAELAEMAEADRQLRAASALGDAVAEAAAKHVPADRGLRLPGRPAQYGTTWLSEGGVVAWTRSAWSSEREIDDARRAFIAAGAAGFEARDNFDTPGNGWVRVWAPATVPLTAAMRGVILAHAVAARTRQRSAAASGHGHRIRGRVALVAGGKRRT